MINQAALRTYILPALQKRIGYPVIVLDQAGDKPAYPYMGWKFLSFIPEQGQPIIEGRLVPSTDSQFEHDREETHITMPEIPLSLSAYGKTEDESHSLAMRAYEWFFLFGREYLGDAGIVVADLMDVHDRTVFLDVTYEYRHGFDVMLRVTSRLSTRKGLIETVKANGKRW